MNADDVFRRYQELQGYVGWTDEAIDKLKTEVDPAKRADLTRVALVQHMIDVGHIPLHHQVIPWAMRSNVTVVHRADNRLTVKWVKIQ